MKGIKALAGLAAVAIALTGAAPVLAEAPAVEPRQTFSYGVNPNVDQEPLHPRSLICSIQFSRLKSVSHHDLVARNDGKASGLYYTARREPTFPRQPHWWFP